MTRWLTALAVFLAWSAVAYKVANISRLRPTRSTRALLAALVLLALSATMLVPSVYTRVALATGEPTLPFLLAESFGIATLAPLCNLMTYRLCGSAVSVRRVVSATYAFMMGLVISITVLWFLDRSGAVDAIDAYPVTDSTSRILFMAAHQLALLSTALYGLVSCLILARAARGGLKAGLMFVAAASTGAVAMVSYVSSFLVAQWTGLSTTAWGPAPVIARTLLCLSVILLALGSTLPDWGPRAVEAIRVRRLLRALKPLWRDLVRASPSVQLEGRRPLLSARAQLHRLMIEIRDAQLQLGAPAADFAAVAQLSGGERRLLAAVEARTLARAAHGHRDGGLPGRGVTLIRERRHVPLHEEAEWLALVAAAWPAANADVSRSHVRDDERRPNQC